jgi:hypothetical protein
VAFSPHAPARDPRVRRPGARVRGTPARTAANAARRHRSSYSGGQGDCLELALNHHPAFAPVRDSKRPTGTVIPFSRDAWRTFVTHLR